MNEYIKYVYRAFLRIHGFVLAVAGFIIAILTWKFGANTKLELWIVTSAIVICILSATTLGDALREALARKIMLPSIRQIARGNEHGFQYSATQAIFLIEESEMFARDAVVSIYSDVEGFEVLVGLGYVLGYTTHGLIQALVNEHPEGAHPDTWKKILENNTLILTKLKVKPSVPSEILTH
jgi:hypothetical protein